MPMTEIRTYPNREVSLVNSGARLQIRPLEEGDAHELLKFFLRVPEEDRFYLLEDVTSPKVINDWVHNIDHERVFPLVCIAEGQIVADGTLHRPRAWARSHIGEIRIVVDPEYRKQGVATLIVRELIDIAYDHHLERVIFKLVEGRQDEAINIAENIGFTREATLYNHIQDMDGYRYDLVVMERHLDVTPEGRYF